VSSIDVMEALLFVADSPATVEELAAAAELTAGQVEQALEILEAHLDEKGPIQLVKIAGGYQLCTKPQFAAAVGRLLKPQGHKLSRSLMEVLAVVAYRQPITIAEVDEVRGVQSDYGIRALLERRLIEEVGRKQTPGRPIMYGTSDEFLHQFKLEDLSQLPQVAPEASAPGVEETDLILFDPASNARHTTDSHE
jgi:segregation and condensation protein B